MTNPQARPTRRATARERAHAFAGAAARVHVAAVEQPAAEGDASAAASQTIAELWLYGVVGGWWWGFDAESVADALRSLPEDVDEVRVRVHSPGGIAVDGVAIGNLFRNHPARFVGVCDGLAASAASVLILGCDEIVMSPGSQVMIHDASVLTYGNAAQLRSDADWIDKQSQNYAEIYALRGGTAEGWRTAMTADGGRGTWYSAAEAVEAGLADRVGTVQSVTPPPPEPDADELGLDEDELAARAAWDRDVLVHPDAWAAWSSNAGARTAPPKPPSASAVGSIHTEGGSAVAFSDEQLTTMRASLELEETADEAAILAAVQAVVAENLEERPAAPTAGIPEGHVTIPAAKLADLEAGAALATATAETLRQQERAAFLDSVKGKYLPTSRAGWEAEYDRDPEGVKAHFAKAAVLIPTTELGHDTPVNENRAETDAAYDAVWGSEKKEA